MTDPEDSWTGSSGELPGTYGVTRLVLMASGPASLHAYWEVLADDIAAAVDDLGGGLAILRLIESATGRVVDDCEVSPHVGSHHFDVPETGATYFAELVIAHHTERITLAATEPTAVPPVHPASGASRILVTREQRLAALRQQATLERTASNVQIPASTAWGTGRIALAQVPTVWLLWPYGVPIIRHWG